ncbi:copper amine oxidase N-terminal domain-containing protein [Paenibacillus tengchongensis]|uniref:copper amine oxidase N-terminal domain-containing protein n=1 Tax=Paenibacillus tengchongensis TaxID=2608684 RepID=UPI0016524CDE|nr:copper amine oxidase N-terminal domain-containing protein [Paenibacillus tengchongensis]
MKRLLPICTVALTLLLAGSPAASSIDNAMAAAPLRLVVDGEAAVTPLRPFTENGLIYVPVRVLNEFYPAELKWNNQSKLLTVSTDYSSLSLKPGTSLLLYEGGGSYSMEGKVILRKGHVYLPAGELNSLSGASYRLDKDKNQVLIESGSVSTSVRVPKVPLALAEGNPAVKLYAALKDGSTYKGYILEVNGVKRSFNWETYRDLSHPPELYYTDITGDGRKEAVIVLTLGSGTGIFQQEIHVIRPEDGSEINVLPAGEAAEQLITSSIADDGADVLVRLKLQRSSTPSVAIRVADRTAEELIGVGFGSVVYYKVESGKLVATANVLVGFAESIGDLKIVYKSGGSGLEAESITFIPYDNYYPAEITEAPAND